MDYEGMQTVVCDAEENDWLSVSYAERKYIEPEQKKPRRKIAFKLNKKIAVIAAVVLCVALLATMFFVDGGFSKEVFDTVKAAYSASIFNREEQQPVVSTIALPSNVTLVEVTEEGVATFNGGRAVMSFTAGTVTEATEDSVTVAIDDDTSIVYKGFTDVYVEANAKVSANALLGKYDGSFTATISVSGQTVKQVVGSDSQLKWNV